MNLEWFLAVLVAWIAVGVGTAFVFGTFTRRSDISDDVDVLAPPVIKHLRPRKRAVQIGVRTQPKMSMDKTKADTATARRVASTG